MSCTKIREVKEQSISEKYNTSKVSIVRWNDNLTVAFASDNIFAESVFTCKHYSRVQMARVNAANIILMKTSFVMVLIKKNIFASVIRLQDVFKTSCQDQYIRLGHTSSRRLQDVLQNCLQDIFKTSCKDIFKTCHQVKLFLLTGLRKVFNTLGHATSEKFMFNVQNLQER